MITPAEFVSQVKRELQRVIWPTQRETVGVTVAVVVMIICAMLYFLASDSVVCFILKKIL